MSHVIQCLFPHGARWVQAHGYTAMKDDDDSRACARALASDGMIEEGLDHDLTLDEALHGVEHALAEWMQAQVLKERDRHDSGPSAVGISLTEMREPVNFWGVCGHLV